jgi:hypothetical protein
MEWNSDFLEELLSLEWIKHLEWIENVLGEMAIVRTQPCKRWAAVTQRVSLTSGDYLT